MSSLARIREFLGQKRLAIVGVSRQPRDFSRALFREFCSRGYEVVPVNPAAREIEKAAVLRERARGDAARFHRARNDSFGRDGGSCARLRLCGSRTCVDIPRRRQWRGQPGRHPVLRSERYRSGSRRVPIYVFARGIVDTPRSRLHPQDRRILPVTVACAS